MSYRTAWLIGCLSAAMSIASAQTGLACPFCTAQSKTLTEEMAAADVVALGELVEPAGVGSAIGTEPGAGDEARFKIDRVIKGQQHLGETRQAQVLFFGDSKPGTRFLLTGMVLPDLSWSTPIPLSERAETYLNDILELPEKGPQRLAFFQDYLRDEDTLLSRDSYDEFARAPYSEVIALKEFMKHDELVAWIKDKDISPSDRRLYLTMLGVCGSTADCPMLEEMMRSDDRRLKGGLDAMIACYLTLQGADGMPLIEELFIQNRQAEYADTYAAIMAIRFHGQETDVIPRPRLIESLRLMLDRPELADLVITDLARWEDWDAMGRLVELFKNADQKTSWVRVPVVNFLLVAQKQAGSVGEQAKTALAKLTEIDAKSVNQAQAYFAFGALGKANPSQAGQPASTKSTTPLAAGAQTDANPTPPEPEPEPARNNQVSPQLESTALAAEPAPQRDPHRRITASRTEMLQVSLGVVLVIVLVIGLLVAMRPGSSSEHE